MGDFFCKKILPANKLLESENGDEGRTLTEATRPHHQGLSEQRNSITAKMLDDSFQHHLVGPLQLFRNRPRSAS
jgi:hypothetical protein